MIYALMAISLVFLLFSTWVTYKQYREGKVVRQIFTKMRAISILISILMVIVLFADFVLFA
ncbi:MAG: hypothetical protein FWB98_07715 [Defluviitaleaceae bacterium]|nr:hypothetical protein [Defluviitaleaceae bacterium]